MAVMLRELPVSDAAVPSGAAPHWYTICGLPVQSEIRLTIPEVPPASAAEPAWVIRLGPPDLRAPMEPAHAPDPSRDENDVPENAFATCLDSTGSWWWWATVATIHISRDARVVTVHPKSGADERHLGLILTGPLASYVLYRLGSPNLHGSAVATPHGAVAFLGAAGYGKSTLAAALASRGMPLLADDLLPLSVRDDGIYVRPSLPVMKLWAPSAEEVLGLRADDLPDVSAHRPKKLVSIDDRLALAREPARLRAMYLLDRYEPGRGGGDAVQMRPLSSREAITTVLAQLPVGSFLQPTEARALLPVFARLVAQAPMRVLSYPGDYARLDVTCARVLADVESR